MHTIQTHKKLAIGSAGLAAGVLLALGLGVVAQDDELDTDPRVIPYNGVLNFNGETFTGLVDLRLDVTDDEGCSFEEEHADVEVFAGRFSLDIGQVIGGVPVCVFNSDRIFVEVGVRNGDEEGPYAVLGGRQKINPAPFAYWAAEGSNFQTDNGAQVTGDLTILGQTTLQTLSTISLSTTDIQGPISNTNGSVTMNDTVRISGVLGTDNDPLLIDTPVQFDGAFLTDVQLNGGLDLTGTLGANNVVDFTVAGGMEITGGVTGQNNVVVRGTLSDSNSTSVTIADGLQVNGGMNVNNAVSMGNNLRVEGSINRNGGDVSINDGLSVTNSAVIGGDLQVNGQAMRVSHNRVPSNGSTLGRSADDSVCFISGVESLNEQNDRCILTINGDNNWAYERREGECNVICMTWRAE